MKKNALTTNYYRIYQEKSQTTGKVWLGYIFEWKGVRKRQSLKIFYMDKPGTFEQREAKKEAELKATEIVRKLNADFINKRYGIANQQDKTSEDFIKYALAWIANHKQIVKEVKKHEGVIQKLKAFAEKQRIFCFEINKEFLERFVKYLQRCLRGESVHSYFVRLRQIINSATEEGYFLKNPATKIKVRVTQHIIKEVLNIDELKLLAKTPLKNENVKRAFLFSAITGLRWVDCQKLNWKNIQGNKLSIIQAKTCVALEIPLNIDALLLLGQPQDNDCLVFNLPSHTAAMKWLRKWVSDAGIQKHITYHCARHSAGTNLLASGASLITTSRILGHTSVVNTQRYIRTSEDLKRQALNQMPSIFTEA